MQSRLASIPRVPLINLPTPLDEWLRLSARLGPRILAKREDLTGFALGGNKSRMFEYILADALKQGADTLIAGAAAQSNYCRQLAAAGARLGLKVILILRSVRGAVDHDVQGNLLLDLLAGADVRVVDVEPSAQSALLDAEAETVRKAGGVPYVPQREKCLGVVAYVRCGVELMAQLQAQGRRPAVAYVAAAGETQAGLALAVKALGADLRVVGIDPGATWINVPVRMAEMASLAAERLGLSVTLSPDEIVNSSAYYGDGYGYPTPAAVDAIKLLARTEGVYLDPVYSSKAMVALIADCAAGHVARGTEALFVHTGGSPALFHYRGHLAVPQTL
jgi:1-aminocyclopropane-1-carboxylate deaminase/D-cysteine desulfhydrase-like pyridoxal-dependent ACC family enzyme